MIQARDRAEPPADERASRVPIASALVVDDETPALDELSYLLRTHFPIAPVHGAQNASDALRYLQERRYEVVFLDVRMPELNGIELGNVLRRFAAAVLSAASLLLLAPAARAADPYEINVILPLTGSIAFVGTTQLQAIKGVEAYINKTGGIGGRPVSFVIQDDQGDPNDRSRRPEISLLHRQPPSRDEAFLNAVRSL